VAYREELKAYLRGRQKELAPSVRERIDLNPMRAFDSDDPGTRQVMEEAPTMLERLGEDDAEHFNAVRAVLDRAGIAYQLDPTLVRGLDYYTRTVFEFESDRLGAQAALGGGGRYDGLVERLGGPATPACGWAAGIERIVLALDEEDGGNAIDVFVAASPHQRERAFALVRELRRAGLRAELDLADRSLKGQMKQADRLGARAAIVLDEERPAQLRDMASGEQRELDLARAVEELGA
jgi:histidyl-tRNA synthetase